MNKMKKTVVIKTNPPESICSKLKELKLDEWAITLPGDFKNLNPEKQTLFTTYLEKWISIEIADRHSRSINSRIKCAKFIKNQTIDDFDFNYNKSTKNIRSEYMELLYNTQKGNIPRAIFVGTAGLGKTHLARALGYAACQAKASVLFINTAKMINLLAAAKSSNRLEYELNKYRRPRILILDEVGYVNMDTEAGNLFFQAISERHDTGLATIATTNIPFGEWNQIFAGNATAHVVVDRLTDGASIFYLEGVSYREYRNKINKNKKRK